ncbi:MAG: NYN domain-containing protein [Planctomycetota bacterium]
MSPDAGPPRRERGRAFRREDEEDGGGRPPRRPSRGEGREPRRPAPAASPRATPPHDPGARREPGAAAPRVAILLDVASLQSEAGDRGAQLSYGRLVRALTSDRMPVRTVAYVPPDEQALGTTLAAQGIETEIVDDEDSVGVAVAVDAMALATRVDCVVLASSAPSMTLLARALRAQGVRVESAGFGADSPWRAQLHHEIGRDCVFVP